MASSLGDRSDGRLVTMTGTGGVGKTTLAVEVARDVAATLTDGAALADDHRLQDFVDLVRAQRGTKIPATTARHPDR